jgi:CRISPR-associated protein Csx10
MATEMMLTLQLLSPLSLHRTRAGVQYVETLDYIPGTAIRGALAETYLAEHGEPDDGFRALFLSDQVQFGDLWPVTSGGSTVLLPASAQACKRHKLKHKDSLRDALLDSLTEQQNNLKCDKCGEPLDRIGGYLRSLEPIDPLSARSRLRVNTAIERSTGSVAREMLFTQHTLVGKRRNEKDRDEDVFFRGPVRIADPNLLNELNHLLAEGTSLFLGAGRSRGLGEIEVTAWQAAAPGDSLTERWKEFNVAAQQSGGDVNRRYFSLTLLSHLAIRDNLLRPVLDNIAPYHLGLPDGVEWVQYKDSDQPVCFLSVVTIPGWNAAQGLPKPDTVALARGSVLLFQCGAPLEQAVLSRLSTIEAEGVGERRKEGFGRLVICHPIHYKWWRK